MKKGAKPVLGLVGGIGSGKSMVAGLLARRGGKVVSGDRIGHEALRQPQIKDRIIARFGAGILDQTGEIDRRALGKVVFADPDQRKALETIVFPWIEERARQEIEAAGRDEAVRFIVLDAAIMLEAGWHKECDHLIFVDAHRDTRLKRLARERGWTAKEVELREQAQMPLDEKRAWTDFEIDNSGSTEHVERQLAQLLRQLGLKNPSR
jgi:dephospho-CoA kinase